MDLPLLSKINSHTKEFINRDLSFDIIESKSIVNVGVYIDNRNVDITLNQFPLFEKVRIFQELGHKIVFIFNKDVYIESQKEFLKNLSILLDVDVVKTTSDGIDTVNNISIWIITDEQKSTLKAIMNKKQKNNGIIVVDSLCESDYLKRITLSNNFMDVAKKMERVPTEELRKILTPPKNNSEQDFTDVNNQTIYDKFKIKMIVEILKKMLPQDAEENCSKYLLASQHLKVSVIVATYNRLNFLPEAIDSLFRQFYKNIEILIVDDGSWDSTKQYCKYIIDKYGKFYDIKYFYQKNKGVGSARNVGFKNATGDLITIFDHDDYMLEDGIIDRVIYFINNPQADVVYAKRDTLLNSGYERIRQKRYEPYHDDGFIDLKTKEEQFNYLISKQVTFGANTMMYRKKILETTGFFYEDKKFMGLEHNVFLLMVFRNYFCYFVDSVVYLMRRNHVDDHLSKKFENNSLREEVFNKVLLPEVLKKINK